MTEKIRASLFRALLVAGVGATVAGAPPVAPTGGPPTAPRLITGDSLERLIAGGKLTLLDVRPNWADYLLNHLPSAQWVQVENFRATLGGLPFQLLPPSGYQTLWSRLGIRRDQPVVVYSAGITQDVDATFVAWLLAASGHPDVYLLDGGYAKWQTDGRTLSRKFARPSQSKYSVDHFRPESADLADVRRAVERKDVLLVDARSRQQFVGEAGAQMRRGHIPGAVDHPWQDDLEQRDLALVWKPIDDLRPAYASQGITADRDIIVYCNTGSEASHVFFALRYLLGYPRVRIYLGGWSEWAEREDLPIETGP